MKEPGIPEKRIEHEEIEMKALDEIRLENVIKYIDSAIKAIETCHGLSEEDSMYITDNLMELGQFIEYMKEKDE